MHSEDKQYNTLIDLIINLSEKIQEKDKIIIRFLEEQEITQNKQKKILEKVEQNLDYLKIQESEINKKIQYLNNNFNLEKIPTKIEIKKLIKDIIEKPKEIENKTILSITKIEEKLQIIQTDITKLKILTQRLEEISLS